MIIKCMKVYFCLKIIPFIAMLCFLSSCSDNGSYVYGDNQNKILYSFPLVKKSSFARASFKSTNAASIETSVYVAGVDIEMKLDTLLIEVNDVLQTEYFFKDKRCQIETSLNDFVQEKLKEDKYGFSFTVKGRLKEDTEKIKVRLLYSLEHFGEKTNRDTTFILQRYEYQKIGVY